MLPTDFFGGQFHAFVVHLETMFHAKVVRAELARHLHAFSNRTTLKWAWIQMNGCTNNLSRRCFGRNVEFGAIMARYRVVLLAKDQLTQVALHRKKINSTTLGQRAMLPDGGQIRLSRVVARWLWHSICLIIWVVRSTQNKPDKKRRQSI